MFNKETFKLFQVILLFIFMTNIVAENKENPAVSYLKLPRWRGFNLLEKFSKNWLSGPFLEEDFKLISEFGFNFVRLPMDYRTWIKNNDWTIFDEEVMKEIDQAVK